MHSFFSKDPKKDSKGTQVKTIDHDKEQSYLSDVIVSSSLGKRGWMIGFEVANNARGYKVFDKIIVGLKEQVKKNSISAKHLNHLLVDGFEDPHLQGGIFSMLLTGSRNFSVARSSRDASYHGHLHGYMKLPREEIIAGGDIIVSNNGNIIFFIPETGGFRADMLQKMKADDAKVGDMPTANQYLQHVQVPSAIIFCDFSDNNAYKQSKEDFLLDRGEWKNESQIKVDKQALLMLLKKLESRSDKLIVNEKLFDNINDEKALGFLNAFALRYEAVLNLRNAATATGVVVAPASSATAPATAPSAPAPATAPSAPAPVSAGVADESHAAEAHSAVASMAGPGRRKL